MIKIKIMLFVICIDCTNEKGSIIGMFLNIELYKLSDREHFSTFSTKAFV